MSRKVFSSGGLAVSGRLLLVVAAVAPVEIVVAGGLLLPNGLPLFLGCCVGCCGLTAVTTICGWYCGCGGR
uniref:Putative secreted peptide n=1 Tax=Anopheles braziliensis TaxID=58242 RepID=A0A2M3ZWX3_9DIPT